MREYYEKLMSLIDEANAKPNEENLMRVESYINFYSDVHKDEYGVRPDVSEFRNMYNKSLRRVWKNMWDKL